MRFVIPVHHAQDASRHHGGAATGDMGTKESISTEEEIGSLSDPISM